MYLVLYQQPSREVFHVGDHRSAAHISLLSSRGLSDCDGMGKGADNSEGSTALSAVPSIKLQYPRNRLLLGTVAHLDNRGVQKALDTQYPLEVSLECFGLPTRNRFFALWQSTELRPFAVVYFREPRGGPWELIGRTETVMHDEYPRFVTKLKLSCSTAPDRLKEIRVILYHRKDKGDDLRDQKYLGVAQCRLDDIVADPLLRFSVPLAPDVNDTSITPGSWGYVTLSADVVRPVKDEIAVIVDVDVASSIKGSQRLFYVLSRQIRSGDYTPVYRSEVLARDEKRFAPLTRAIAALTAGVEGKLLRLELYQFCPRGNHFKLGFMQTSIAKLREAEVNTRQLWWPAHNQTGVVEIGRVVLTSRNIAEDSVHFKFRFTQ